MKKICCFCERWESGGIESFLHNVLVRMDLTGMEVDIVASQIKDSVFSQDLRERGVRFRELSGSQQKIWENHRLFEKLLRERQYNVLHLNIFQGMSLYYAHLARQAGVPTRIAHSHNTDLRKSRIRQAKLLLHRLYSARYAADATALWACSQNAAEFMFPARLMAERGFTFIPNGIETERFRYDPAARKAVRQELGIANQFVIGTIGRLCYQKNQSFLLDVFAEAVRLRPESRLLLVGEGEDLPLLKEKARRLRIENRVIFYGTTPCPERLLWAMDAFAFPSLFEGLGIAAVEAQAAGLTAVCSENVPREAAVTDRCFCTALSDGALTWTKALLNAAKAERNPMAAEAVKCAGFDIKSVLETIRNKYMKGP